MNGRQGLCADGGCRGLDCRCDCERGGFDQAGAHTELGSFSSFFFLCLSLIVSVFVSVFSRFICLVIRGS